MKTSYSKIRQEAKTYNTLNMNKEKEETPKGDPSISSRIFKASGRLAKAYTHHAAVVTTAKADPFLTRMEERLERFAENLERKADGMERAEYRSPSTPKVVALPA